MPAVHEVAHYLCTSARLNNVLVHSQLQSPAVYEVADLKVEQIDECTVQGTT